MTHMRSVGCLPVAAALFALPAAATGSARSPEYAVETVVTGLQYPWSLAFLPGGDLLVSEKYGGVRRIHDNRLEPDALEGGPQHILQHGDSGLLDIALDPEFERNHRLFISFNEGTDAANHLALYSARLDGDGLSTVA